MNTQKIFGLIITISLFATACGSRSVGGNNNLNNNSNQNQQGLLIELDPSSPAATYIPQWGANILYTIFALTAVSDQDIVLELLPITRVGATGHALDFDEVGLYMDGIQRGGSRTFNTNTDTANFVIVNDPIIIPAGTTVLLEVRASMDSEPDHSSKLCIMDHWDIEAYYADYTLMTTFLNDFPICGNDMTTVAAQ